MVKENDKIEMHPPKNEHTDDWSLVKRVHLYSRARCRFDEWCISPRREMCGEAATLVTQAEAFNLLKSSGNSREITADRSPGVRISSSFNTCSNFRALVTFQSWSLGWTIQSMSHHWLHFGWKSIFGPNFLIWHARLLSVALSRMWTLSGKDRVLQFVVLTGWLAGCICGGKCKLTNCEEEQGGEGEDVEGSNSTN